MAENLITALLKFEPLSFLKEQLSTFPQLDIKGESKTHYLDFINPEDMKSSIMIGMDKWKRPFIAFKIQVCDNKGEKFETVDVFFKRYTIENNKKWCYANNNKKNYLWYENLCEGQYYSLLKERLMKFMKKESVYVHDVSKFLKDNNITSCEYEYTDEFLINGNSKYQISLV